MPVDSYIPLPSRSTLSDLKLSYSAFLWNQLVSLSRSTVCHALQMGIKHGGLQVIEEITREGQPPFSITVGQPDAKVCRDAGYRFVTVKVHDEAFWVRVYTSNDVGFSEAYMTGEVTLSPGITDFLNLYVDNRESLTSLSTGLYMLKRAFDLVSMRFFRHGLTKSLQNIATYNVSNDFYKAFLSSEMQFSCPMWGPEEGGVRGDLEGFRKPGDLEAAQARKINYALKQARLRPKDRLLEIGCGWGTVALAAGKMGCSVDALTLSFEQKAIADQRIKEAGLESQVRIHLMDYRNMPPEFEKAFDACISIEMVEAVGIAYMPTYIKLIDWALKDDRAAVVIGATTYPESTYTPYQGTDFVRKYHWVNTIAPSPTGMAEQFRDVLKGRFSFESLKEIGTHYPRCLREWNRRLSENWTPALQASLKERYPELRPEGALDILKRRWEFMFLYTEVGFGRVWLAVHYWTFVRPGCPIEISY